MKRSLIISIGFASALIEHLVWCYSKANFSTSVSYGFFMPVSYTHLDVYKRQLLYPSLNNKTVPTDKNRFLFEACLLYTSRCV